MTKAKVLGVVGTFLLSLACGACGADEGEGSAPAPAPASDPSAEPGGFGFEAPAKAIVRRTAGGRIDVRVNGASNVTYEIEGLPAGIEKKEQSDTAIALAFGSSEPKLGEHAIKVRAKSGNVTREQSLSLIVADDPGTLDKTFADKGLAAGNLSTTATSIAVDAKGRTLVAGHEKSGKHVVVSRYLASGELDLDFDGDGVVSTAYDFAKPFNFSFSIATGADGSTFVGGVAFTDLKSPGAPCVAKLDEKGAPAAGFGSAGVACIDDPTFNSLSAINSIVLLADGSILAGGFTGGLEDGDPFVMKLAPSGTLDGSFGVGGIVRITTGGDNDTCNRIAVDSKGRIILVGDVVKVSDSTAFVARLSSAGKLDPWFGASGMLKLEQGATTSTANGIAIGPNDEIFVSGSEDKNGFILGLEPEKGEPLGSFGTNGGVTIAAEGSTIVRSLQWDEGKLVAVGGAISAAGRTPMARRFSMDGSLDVSFGQAGAMTLPNGSSAIAVSTDASSRALLILESETGYVVARAWR